MRSSGSSGRARAALGLALPAICATLLSGAPFLAIRGGDGGRESTSALMVDLALAGSATASSAQAASPASNAIDGSASTTWCPATGAASLVVDLGRERRLQSVGLTLPASDPPATVSVALA